MTDLSEQTDLSGLAAADDATIRAMVAQAELPPLLVALAYLTGDDTTLPARLRPPTISKMVPQGGYSAEQQEQARSLAFETLTAIRDGRTQVAPNHDQSRLLTLVQFMVAESAQTAERYLPLLMDEIGVDGDPAAPAWNQKTVAPDRAFHVVVVGAGMSGLVAAFRLAQAGVSYTIVEKNEDVGGTWLENSYPGCRVDVSNHLYSYSFAQRTDWPQYFSTQEVLLDYFRDFADSKGLRENIRFGTEVVSAEYAGETSDDSPLWTVTVRTPEGVEERIAAHAVISAVGQLNRPHFPAIEGRDAFRGQSFHSARWDHDIDLSGKRVAVIGTGASAFQFVPIIAEQVDRMVIFQRTPPWLGPAPTYHDDVADGMQWLFGNVPHYSQWYRFWLFTSSVEGMLPSVEVDPTWPVSERSVSASNEQRRLELTRHLERQFADRPDLLRTAVPDYPPGAKRMLKDNGVWGAALRRPNVELTTTAIERITETGVRTVDGRDHEVDVLIYATGFTASDFLTPMRVTGRDGIDLHAQWNGDARAYLGITVPNFPNLFCMYGPNTNIVVNGSIIFFSECEATYIVESIRAMLAGGHRAMDVRKDVHDAYNELIDDGNRRRAWGASTVNAWYKNSYGRVSQNWPFTLMDYWQRTRQPDLSDYDLY